MVFHKNKDENVHRFALSAIRGELLEREIERKRQIETERERERKIIIDMHIFVK